MCLLEAPGTAKFKHLRFMLLAINLGQASLLGFGPWNPALVRLGSPFLSTQQSGSPSP